MEHVSDRIKNMAESATLAMAAKAREFKEKGIDVISLSLGEPDFKTPKHIQEGAKEAIDSEKYFAYPPVNGYLDLRQAISKKFKEENGLDYDPGQIVVSNGAKQSIVNVMMSLVNPGDEVIVLAPFWVSYTAAVEMAEGVPVIVKGGLEDDFKATAAQVKAAMTEKTRAIIFSSPCNPTGSVFTKEELSALADVVKEQEGVYVISDEIYEHINFSGAHASIGALPGMQDRTITINGMAKGFAMTGWRVGYIGAPTWLAKACNKIQGQVTSANCSIAQRATLTALTTDLGPTRAMAEQYHKRRALVYDLLNDIPGVKTNMPQGAFYFFPDVSSYFGKSDGKTTIKDANELCLYLLSESHVSLVSGEDFGNANCVRLSYAASEENLKEALKRIKETLAKLS
ncbi:pyridoxal phosphate-dependent aminotransferase [Reichenbachiella carrageenanivorans]|uniref:Aminotransferase n=1 Tax=Reichenbachiella carrageenanivorans TaxID=2979869 RepID=A0ABY6CWP1_9BACT|nr:pyridoxal phosphate-dependent aminotransferase [Reichenbachiella carrageenanivorans]UXX78336.1 pyridoxal phosphate-dependent aminotransferase [Reichenbachiella carrageenanivorans]